MEVFSLARVLLNKNNSGYFEEGDTGPVPDLSGGPQQMKPRPPELAFFYGI